MTMAVVRYRCDLCGATYLMEGQAQWCEKMCAEQEAIAIETRQGGDVQQAPSQSDESAGRQASPRSSHPSSDKERE